MRIYNSLGEYFEMNNSIPIPDVILTVGSEGLEAQVWPYGISNADTDGDSTTTASEDKTFTEMPKVTPTISGSSTSFDVPSARVLDAGAYLSGKWTQRENNRVGG